MTLNLKLRQCKLRSPHKLSLTTEFILVQLCRKLLVYINTLKSIPGPLAVLRYECKVSCSRKQQLAPDWV